MIPAPDTWRRISAILQDWRDDDGPGGEDVRYLVSIIEDVHMELGLIRAERQRVASGSLTCAECDSILARW